MKKIYRIFLKFLFLITIILLFPNILPQWAGCPSDQIVVAYKQERGFSPEKAGFAVQCNAGIFPYRVFGVYTLPAETLNLEIIADDQNGNYAIHVSSGWEKTVSLNKWLWQAPDQPGLYLIKIVSPTLTDSIQLNVFVMTPYNQLKGEYLNGYRIGRYPRTSFKQRSVYQPPRGFIEVTKENEETLVSPHFRLKNFLCKQTSGYPKYLVLQEHLLSNMELIVEKLKQESYPVKTLRILSGYRTPYYNKVIGNVKYSYHLWGGAADIYIDNNSTNAAILYNTLNDLIENPPQMFFIGGLSKYKKTSNHGPFVHIDVRGCPSRW